MRCLFWLQRVCSSVSALARMFSRSRQPLKSFQSARTYLRRLLAGLFCRTRPPVHGRVRHRAQAPLVDNTKLQVRPGYLDNFVSAGRHGEAPQLPLLAGNQRTRSRHPTNVCINSASLSDPSRGEIACSRRRTVWRRDTRPLAARIDHGGGPPTDPQRDGSHVGAWKGA